MKLSSFILAALAGAAIAAAALPAQAQRSVSGTIGAAHAAQEAASAGTPSATAPAKADNPIPAPAAGLSSAPPAAAAAGATAATGTAGAAPAAAAPAAAPSATGPAALGMGPAPSTSATAGLLQTTLALLFVLALLVGLAWLLRRFGPRNFGGGNNTVKLVGALSVGARERILVVEVGEQWIVVGASPGRMNALATMPRQEGPIPGNGGATPPASANFAEWFKQTIEKRNGK
ncbi:flagellar biosynthetic protein FliO [Oxalobacteraceae bacterium A2-2]